MINRHLCLMVFFIGFVFTACVEPDQCDCELPTNDTSTNYMLPYIPVESGLCGSIWTRDVNPLNNIVFSADGYKVTVMGDLRNIMSYGLRPDGTHLIIIHSANMSSTIPWIIDGNTLTAEYTTYTRQ